MTQEALARAGLRLDEIKLFVFNTPTAWFHRYFAALLGIDSSGRSPPIRSWRTSGPVLIPASLHFAASRGRIARGDLVLLFSSAACRRRRPRSCGGETSPSGPIRSRVCERLTCFTTEKAP
jgi:3-oxoacyl-[acyl-carrier-protein] synthase III